MIREPTKPTWKHITWATPEWYENAKKQELKEKDDNYIHTDDSSHYSVDHDILQTPTKEQG